MLDTFGADNDYDDATVPLTGAIGHDQPMDTPLVRRVPDQHGNLQRNQAAFDEIEEILTAQPVRRRAGKPVTLRVAVPDLIHTGEELPVTVDIDRAERQAIRITVADETGRLLQTANPRPRRGTPKPDSPACPPAPTRSVSPV